MADQNQDNADPADEVEQLRAKVAQLEQRAATGDALVAREAGRIKNTARGLAREQQATIDRHLQSGNVEIAAELLGAYQAASTAARTSPIGPGGPPAPAGHDEIETMIASGMRPDDIRRKDPERWNRWVKERLTLQPLPAAGVAAMFRSHEDPAQRAFRGSAAATMLEDLVRQIAKKG